MRARKLALLAVLMTTSVAARADGFGTIVTGAQYIKNDRSYNLFDRYHQATVAIRAGLEFASADIADTDTVDFTGTTLTIVDTNRHGAAPFEMDFTDTAFASFMQTSNNFGYTYSFSGDTLKVFYEGNLHPGTYTTTFTYTTTDAAVTPEPSSLALFITGLLGMIWMGRFRREAYTPTLRL